MTRKTFPIPPGHEPVRDSEGRATGEVRPCSAGSDEPPHWREIEIVRLINALRADEGDSVTILCDNPDFNGQPNCAIECCGDWTGWLHKRFAADTLLDTLSMAMTERNLPSPRKVIATSNGHHWIQRFNLVCCRDCGFVRRADDQNKPCKGPVGVGLRRDLLPDHFPDPAQPVTGPCTECKTLEACKQEGCVIHWRPSARAQPTPKPIGWRWKFPGDGAWTISTRYPGPDVEGVQPLYAAQQQAEIPGFTIDALHKQALKMPPADQHKLAEIIAANVGYELAPEPPHPDCPHERSSAGTASAGSLETKLRDAHAALRSIAEGNLGDSPWQANYETIKQVARNALSGEPVAVPQTSFDQDEAYWLFLTLDTEARRYKGENETINHLRERALPAYRDWHAANPHRAHPGLTLPRPHQRPQEG